ncbi:MAG: hypothetical protein ACK4P1_05825, partial [Aggregatilineales bacterium]
MLRLIMFSAVTVGAFFSGLAICRNDSVGVWLGGALLLLVAVVLGFLSRRVASARQSAKQQAQAEQILQ